METDMSPPSLDGVASVGGVVGGLVTDDREAPLPAAEVTSGTTSCAATIDLAGAARTEWGVLVIGAGPAGALAARQSALLGLKTLLVDKSPFPRAKVCGGCISGLGRHVLERVGLGHLVKEPAATPLDRFDLAAAGRRVSLALPLGAAISRYHFDAALVREAVAAGAEFLSETTAQVRGPVDAWRLRGVSLQGASRATVLARSRLVLTADGLGRTSLKRHGPFAPQVAAASRVGLSATIRGDECDLPSGTVSMSVGRDGYVGMVRVPGGSINVAAAVDPDALRERGPAGMVKAILVDSSVESPLDSLESTEWRGTGLLTRHSPRVAAKRLLLLGDAAGYVEPFTGEGMTWAMLSAVSVVALADQWLRTRQDDYRRFADLADAWSREHRSLVARRQRDCRVLTWLLRHPTAVRTALGVFSLAPGIAKPLVHYFWNQKDLP
jgi:menaquinone-9 beta-reductase